MLSILCAPLKESISNVASLSPEMQYGRFGLGHVRPLGLNGPAFDAAGLGGMIVPGSLGWVWPTNRVRCERFQKPWAASERVEPPPVTKVRPPLCTSVTPLSRSRYHQPRSQTAAKFFCAQLNEVS